MKAAKYNTFGGPIEVVDIPLPAVPEHGALIAVRATGICRSDWYGWLGFDKDIRLPHVPGHEFAGEVVEAGTQVRHWQPGDRVTAPFVCGCGHCVYCEAGQQQVCPDQTQPGFTHFGSFAEYVVVHHADVNLVRLPGTMDYAEAASMGCRFGTAFRAVFHQAKLQPGEAIAIFGCGGVGLSAIMLSAAIGAEVIAIDLSGTKLQLAQSLGAQQVINAHLTPDLPKAIQDLTDGGPQVSIDAIGNPAVMEQGIRSLRKQGRHIQVGLMEGEHRSPRVPMARIITDEIRIIGSHGIQAHRYPEMFDFIRVHGLDLQSLISDRVSLRQGIDILCHMDTNPPRGVAVIEGF